MNNEDFEVKTSTSDYLQINEQVDIGCGYWFEIIEIEEKNVPQQGVLSTNGGNKSLAGGKSKSFSSAKNVLDGVWADMPWKCFTCLAEYDSVVKLTEHTRDVHKLDIARITWICGDCQRTLPHYSALINHIRRVHRKNLSLVCDICNKECVSFKDLEDHRNGEHKTDYKPVIIHCETCGKVYKSKYVHQRHTESHFSNVPRVRFECNICNKNYSSRYALKEHMLVHGDPEFTCKICGRQFKRKLNLVQHLAIHVTTRSFQCRLCHKLFKTPVGLTSHYKTHKRKSRVNCKLFPCNTCGRLFRARHSLMIHQRYKHDAQSTVEEHVNSEQSSSTNKVSSHTSEHIKAETGDEGHIPA